MEEYLVYVEYIGSDLDGNYIYKLDFSTQPEVVWGESWNVMPAAICGHIPPDPNTIFKTAKMYSPEELYTAVKSTCFSMQDCIDGIIPLCFANINETDLKIDDSVFRLRFGEHYEDTLSLINKYGLIIKDIETLTDNDDKMDDLISKLEGEKNDDDFIFDELMEDFDDDDEK